jgi:peptidoglycan hydrolase-like protein with peptidoglycan-binding domain
MAYCEEKATTQELDEIKGKLSNKEQELKIITHELGRIKNELDEIADSIKNTGVKIEKTDQEDFKVVQTALKMLGYYDGEVDGIFGPKTNNALKSFHKKEKLDSTWRLNSKLCIRLADRVSNKKHKGLSPEEVNQVVSELLGLCRQLMK